MTANCGPAVGSDRAESNLFPNQRPGSPCPSGFAGDTATRVQVLYLQAHFIECSVPGHAYIVRAQKVHGISGTILRPTRAALGIQSTYSDRGSERVQRWASSTRSARFARRSPQGCQHSRRGCSSGAPPRPPPAPPAPPGLTGHLTKLRRSRQCRRRHARPRTGSAAARR